MTSSIAAAWLATAVLVGTVERQHLARSVQAATTLELGASEAELLLLLGRPLSDTEAYDGWSLFAIGKHPRQWCYGTRVNLNTIVVTDCIVSVNPVPLNFRLFGYGDDDLVIDLTKDDRVASIDIPRIQYEIDRRFDGVLEMCYAIHAIGEAISEARK